MASYYYWVKPNLTQQCPLVWSQPVFGLFLANPPPHPFPLIFSVLTLISFTFWLQRLTRGRHLSLHSTWRKSPKWRKRWARDHPPSPRAKSSQASLRLSARTGQQGLQQPQSPQGHWNRGKEAPWLRTACWARISMWRWPLSCWWSFQVILLFYAEH